jgi:hypothetical protein
LVSGLDGFEHVEGSSFFFERRADWRRLWRRFAFGKIAKTDTPSLGARNLEEMPCKI